MSFKTKKPPIRVLISIEEFNSFINFLDSLINSETELFISQASALKNKILKYCVIHTNEEGETLLDIRFFNNEASSLICVLLKNIRVDNISTNYYQLILNNKKINKGDEYLDE